MIMCYIFVRSARFSQRFVQFSDETTVWGGNEGPQNLLDTKVSQVYL